MTKMIDIYFDYVCPYSYIASKREAVLKKDLDAEYNWRPWEIHPERPLQCETRTSLKCSFIVQRLAEEIGLDITMPVHLSNSQMALLGAEFAKKKGKFGAYHHGVFHTHWEEKKDISDIGVLREVCARIGMDPDEFEQEVSKPEYDEILKENDREADRIGVELVPSYILGDKIVVGNVPLANVKAAIEDYVRG